MPSVTVQQHLKVIMFLLALFFIPFHLLHLALRISLIWEDHIKLLNFICTLRRILSTLIHWYNFKRIFGNQMRKKLKLILAEKRVAAANIFATYLMILRRTETRQFSNVTISTEFQVNFKLRQKWCFSYKCDKSAHCLPVSTINVEVSFWVSICKMLCK